MGKLKAGPQRVAIWDLDHTLIDSSKRMHYLQRVEPDWPAFHAHRHLDTIYPHAKEVYLGLRRIGIMPIISTYRPEEARNYTRKFLADNGLSYPYMYMRADGLDPGNVAFKYQVLLWLREKGYEIVVAFEDNPDIVAMYRGCGVPCWAADDGSWRHPHAPKTSVHPQFTGSMTIEPAPGATSEQLRNPGIISAGE